MTTPPSQSLTPSLENQPAQAGTGSSSLSGKQPFPNRTIRPLSQRLNKDTLPERRRSLFLNKVRQNRDDKRWEVRSEDLARLDWMTQKREWEREVLRDAPPAWDQDHDLGQDSQDDDQVMWSQQQQQYHDGGMGSSSAPQSQSWTGNGMSGGGTEYEEVDEVLNQEEAELEALVALMEEEEQDRMHTNDDGQDWDSRAPGNGVMDDGSSAFGSDDEVYEDIFSGFVVQGHGQDTRQQEQGDEMDLSH